MTDEDIERMAREAGFHLQVWNSVDGTEIVPDNADRITDEIKRFASLVAAAERERVLSMLQEFHKAAGDRHNYYAWAANQIRARSA